MINVDRLKLRNGVLFNATENHATGFINHQISIVNDGASWPILVKAIDSANPNLRFPDLATTYEWLRLERPRVMVKGQYPLAVVDAAIEYLS